MPSINYDRCIFVCGDCHATHRAQGFWRWFLAGVRCSCPCKHVRTGPPLAEQLAAAGVTDFDGAMRFFEANARRLEGGDR